jgi:UDP-N-acetylmuramate dehydrogenase
LKVGGPADQLITVTTEAELVDAVSASDAAGRPVLILAGGSNVVISDEPFLGDVIRVHTRGVDVVDRSDCAGVTLTVAAGEPWDDVVSHAVGQDWVGIEALSGIPGSAGATPIQNVGAYGQEVSQTIAQVRTFDRQDKVIKTFATADCDFGYRSSRFRHNDRWLVLDVTFQLAVGTMSTPVEYAELAQALSIDVGQRAPLADVRSAVLDLRQSKSMVINTADPDAQSAGSFFTNPLLTAEQAANLPSVAPRWPASQGQIKTSAAWLIEQAGFVRGFRSGSAGISSKHTLALTTQSPASATDVIALARLIIDSVDQAFGIVLSVEPTLVGLSLERP